MIVLWWLECALVVCRSQMGENVFLHVQQQTDDKRLRSIQPKNPCQWQDQDPRTSWAKATALFVGVCCLLFPRSLHFIQSAILYFIYLSSLLPVVQFVALFQNSLVDLLRTILSFIVFVRHKARWLVARYGRSLPSCPSFLSIRCVR